MTRKTLQELSKGLLGHYVGMASRDAATKMYVNAVLDKDHDYKAGRKMHDKAEKRLRGVKKATNRLTKEDEMPKKTLWDILGEAGAGIVQPETKSGRTFWKFHRVRRTNDRNGDGDDVHQASKISPAGLKTHGNDGTPDGVDATAEVMGEALKKKVIPAKPAGAGGDKVREEDVEQIDELSGKALGSYIQAAHKDQAKKIQHNKELNDHPSVKKHAEKRREYYNRREYDSRGHSKHQNQITNTYSKETKAKEKLDPNFRKNTNFMKRHRGIEKAVAKLSNGRLSEGTLDEKVFGKSQYQWRRYNHDEPHTLSYRGKHSATLTKGATFGIRAATSQKGTHRVIVPHHGETKVHSMSDYEANHLKGKSHFDHDVHRILSMREAEGVHPSRDYKFTVKKGDAAGAERERNLRRLSKVHNIARKEFGAGGVKSKVDVHHRLGKDNPNAHLYRRGGPKHMPSSQNIDKQDAQHHDVYLRMRKPWNEAEQVEEERHSVSKSDWGKMGSKERAGWRQEYGEPKGQWLRDAVKKHNRGVRRTKKQVDRLRSEDVVDENAARVQQMKDVRKKLQSFAFRGAKGGDPTVVRASSEDKARHYAMAKRWGKPSGVYATDGKKSQYKGRGLTNVGPSESEQIDELSTKTLGSYVKKAASSSVGAAINQSKALHSKPLDAKGFVKNTDTIAKRRDGIGNAVDRLSGHFNSANLTRKNTFRKHPYKGK